MKKIFAITLLLAAMHAQSQPPTLATFKIMTYNIYGLNRSDCKTRYKAIGEHIATASPLYDIIGLQEFYDRPGDVTCEPHHLNNAIWAGGQYQQSYNYDRYNPETLGASGGIGIFTLHRIHKFRDWPWLNGNEGFFEANEGFIFARILIERPQMYLDVYVVHLNSGGGERTRRKIQLLQLASMIKKWSKKSGNPVLVMGDFNIGGPPTNSGNPGYGDIMEVLKNPVDIWTLTHPGELGFTTDCIVNGIARREAGGCDHRQRIDYMFWVTDRAYTNSLYRIRIPDSSKVRILQWMIPSTEVENDFRHVSDHFGIEATIDVYKISRKDLRQQPRPVQGNPTRHSGTTRER